MHDVNTDAEENILKRNRWWSMLFHMAHWLYKYQDNFMLQ